MQHTHWILDSHYEKYNLRKVAPESKYLLEEGCVMLHDVSSKH